MAEIRRWLMVAAMVIGLLAVGTARPTLVEAKNTFVTIGTGGLTGVYYPTGGAISRMINAKRKEYNIRASVESTGGSVSNVNAIMSGDLEFGIVQSDRQYQAWKGLAEWKEKGPQTDLRAVFSIHPESITLVRTFLSNNFNIIGRVVMIGNAEPLPTFDLTACEHRSS